MKVKFSESFITKLKTVGTTIGFSKYKICSLVDKDRLLDDSAQTAIDEGDFSYIWNEETKAVDLTILGTDKLTVETTSNPFIIYLYEDCGLRKVGSPALVLYNDKYLMLNLTSKGLNHITIKFPTTYANIQNKLDNRNQRYLESKSNLTGTSIFLAKLGIGNEDDLITKNSYLKYVRNKISSNNISTYLNKDGKKISSKSWYKRYTKVNLFASNLIGNRDKDGTQNYYLPSTSGTITISGECTYDLYEVREGKFILRKKSQTCGIDNVVLVGLNSDTDKFKIVNNKTISYVDVEDSSTTSFQGKLFFRDEMKEGLQVPLLSNKINLYQYSTWGKPSTTTNLFESGKHLFLFDNKGYAIGTSVGNNNRYHEITVKLKKSIDPSSISVVHSSAVVGKYFHFNVDRDEAESRSGSHSYKIRISTIGENSSKEWYPLIDGTSTLLSSTISLGPNNKIQIFCVQGPTLPMAIRDITRTGDLEKNSKGNYIGHLDGVIGKKKADYYVTSNSLVEGYNTWVCSYKFSDSSVNFVNRRIGKIVETIGESGKVSITSYSMPSTEEELGVGSLTFKRAPTSGEIDYSNWRDVMYSSAGFCSLDLILARDTSLKPYSTITSSTQYFLKESDSSLKRLYLFDHLGKTFENTDNQDVAEHWFEFLVDEMIPKNSIVLETNGLDKFFDIKVESAVESTRKAGWYRYRVIITTKGENNSDTIWLPTNSSNLSDTIKAKIELKSAIKDHKIVEEFYCVQSFQVDSINVYVENKKPEWVELIGNHGVTSASNSGIDFEFDSQEKFDKYTSDDSKLANHSVGDIITLGKIKSGIRRVEKFKMLVNTYHLYNSKNEYLDFKKAGDTVSIALSKPVNEFTHWKEVSVKNEKLQLISSSPDNLLNDEFVKIGDGKFIYSNTNKDLPTAKYKISIKNLIEPSRNHNIISTTLFDRVSSNTIEIEDLLSDWKYLMMKNNSVSTAEVMTRVLTSNTEDNIIVRTDDKKEWDGINLLPLDYIGIYRIYVSCPEDFFVTISGNDDIHFLDESNNNPLLKILSVDFEKTAQGQFIPIYFTFEGGERNAFKSAIQDLETEINIAYKRDPSINKKVLLRRYYIDNIPSDDGKDLGSKTSTGNLISTSISPYGSDPVSSVIARSGSGLDSFCSYDKNTKKYSTNISYISGIETNSTTTIPSKVVKISTFDLARFAGNRYKEKDKYVGDGKGYLYTSETIEYTEYPSRIGSSYPLSVIDTIRVNQKSSSNGLKYSVYNTLQEPRVTLSSYDYLANTRYGNKIYLAPINQNTLYQFTKQEIYVDISVPGQSFRVRKLRGDKLKLLEDNKVYLNRYDKNPIKIRFDIPEGTMPTVEEKYMGTIEIESYIDKDNFLLDENGRLRTGSSTYSQEVVNLIAGTTKVTFDIYVALKNHNSSVANKDYHTFSQDFGGMIPAEGGSFSIELNPSFENTIISQTPDKTPFSGGNIAGYIKVSSLLGKKYLNVDFTSRAFRTSYTNSGIDLAPSVTNPKYFCDSKCLPKILELSDGNVADNFSVTFEPEGSETSRVIYNTADQIPSFTQQPYTHGLVLSGPFKNSEGNFLMGDLQNNSSKLFVGRNNDITIRIRSKYSDFKGHGRLIALLFPFYLASVELPTSGQTEFKSYDSDSLIISNLSHPNNVITKIGNSRYSDNILKGTLFNYGYYFPVGDNSEDFIDSETVHVRDSWGNSVSIMMSVELKVEKS